MILPALRSSIVRTILMPALCLGMCAIPAMAQDKGASTSATSTALIRPGQLPNSAYPYLTSLGERLTKAGKERLVMQATLSDSKGSRSVRLIWELPGRFRYDEDGNSKPIIVDGKAEAKGNAVLSANELDTVETFLNDSPQGFFESLQSGAAYRFLGRGFRAAVEPGRTSPASAHDIYQVAVPLDYEKAKSVRAKMYYFDSTSGLLSKVRYRVPRGSAIVQVETILSDWVKVDGEFVPGRIQRNEDGKAATTVVSKGASASIAQEDGIFPKP
jgi:hypothetical protein